MNVLIVLQPSSYVLCLVLLSIQEPAVHLVAPIQVENYHIPRDLSLSGFGGSILLFSAGRLYGLLTILIEQN